MRNSSNLTKSDLKFAIVTVLEKRSSDGVKTCKIEKVLTHEVAAFLRVRPRGSNRQHLELRIEQAVKELQNSGILDVYKTPDRIRRVRLESGYEIKWKNLLGRSIDSLSANSIKKLHPPQNKVISFISERANNCVFIDGVEFRKPSSDDISDRDDDDLEDFDEDDSVDSVNTLENADDDYDDFERRQFARLLGEANPHESQSPTDESGNAFYSLEAREPEVEYEQQSSPKLREIVESISSNAILENAGLFPAELKPVIMLNYFEPYSSLAAGRILELASDPTWKSVVSKAHIGGCEYLQLRTHIEVASRSVEEIVKDLRSLVEEVRALRMVANMRSDS